MKTLYLTPLLLALSIGQAFASTPINLSKDIRPNAKVSIDNVKGEVTVTAWDKNQIQVSGTLGDGARPLEIEGSDGNVEIHVDSDSKEHSMFSWGSDTRMQPTVLNVRVPKAVSVEVNVVRVNRMYPRALLTPFTDNVTLTPGDRRAYARQAKAQRSKRFERIEVGFLPRRKRDRGDEEPGPSDGTG